MPMLLKIEYHNLLQTISNSTIKNTKAKAKSNYYITIIAFF